ncbi:Unknown protein sequence [Pseudomonas syringae pv. maculicola]|nr:Unknown protein sequence [Pseudomonas syringae pv. maculicola]
MGTQGSVSAGLWLNIFARKCKDLFGFTRVIERGIKLINLGP